MGGCSSWADGCVGGDVNERVWPTPIHIYNSSAVLLLCGAAPLLLFEARVKAGKGGEGAPGCPIDASTMWPGATSALHGNVAEHIMSPLRMVV